MIYLDHNSTTPLAAEAAAAMLPWMGERFGNPASQHACGRRARQALEDAREEIARILGARLSGRDADRLIFTSGGTEANNLALFGITAAGDTPPGSAIVSAIEHPSVLAAAERLSGWGWRVPRLGATPAGVVDLNAFDALVDETHETTPAGRLRLVSVMMANNETGVLQPVAEIARRCRVRGVPLHSDAAQVAGKLPLDFRGLDCAALTVAAHKFHGPLGIGALLVRHDVALRPLVVGGFQQEGLRGGTESVALAVGMHAALGAWEREHEARAARMRRLRDRLEARLAAALGDRCTINGAAAERLPHTSSVAFAGIDRQVLVMALDLAGVACSTGSACASGSSEPSHVLAAMGASRQVLAGSVRFSLGAATRADEIDAAAERIVAACAQAARETPAPVR